MKRRVQIAACLDPIVVAAARNHAEATGQSFSRVLDAAARRGLGLPEVPPLPTPHSQPKRGT
jgi:hypothetical protein